MTAALDHEASLFAHPDVLAAGNRAWGALDRAFLYCRFYKTDGFIRFDAAYLLERRKRVWEHLATTEGGGWVTLVEGGYSIRNYLRWREAQDEALRAAAEVGEDARLTELQRQQRREAGLASAAARARRANGAPTDEATGPQRRGNGDGNGEATGANGEPTESRRSPSSGGSPSQPQRDPENPDLRGGVLDQPPARADERSFNGRGNGDGNGAPTGTDGDEPPPPRESGVFGTAEALTLVTMELELPEGEADNARMSGLRDVEGAWTKFKAKKFGQRVPLHRAWTTWVVDEKRYEARDGARPRPGTARASPRAVQPVPDGGRRWQVGGEG